MLVKTYNRLRYWISKKEEKGEASSGFLPPRVRKTALSIIDPSVKSLLEMGCGKGLFLSMVSNKLPHAKIVGLESSEHTLQQTKRTLQAKRILNVKFVLGNAEKVDFESGIFDRILCLNMFYNLSSKEAVEKVILEMARMCKEDGSIIFDIRNRSNPLVRFAYKNVKSYDPKCPWPLNAYTLKEIKDLLKNHSLRIKKIIPVISISGALPLTYLIEAGKA